MGEAGWDGVGGGQKTKSVIFFVGEVGVAGPGHEVG